tara:strand:- start:199 stop:684 length:486 start_codon:yes stop_codon:yes gene_type:complete
MWTPRRFVAALEKHAPVIGQALRQIQEKLKVGDRAGIDQIFADVPSISIDYAMTEKLDNEDMLIIKGDFGWSDIGAWDTLHDQRVDVNDASKNVIKGQVIAVDSNDNLFYASDKRVIAAAGVSNLVVVDTGDVVLVCDKNQAQRVKELIAEIKTQGLDHLL